MAEDSFTIAEAVARSGLPESTLRYWERIGLVRPIERDASSRHRRYSAADVATLETLANLRAVGLSIEDMRAYLAGARRGDAAAGERGKVALLEKRLNASGETFVGESVGGLIQRVEIRRDGLLPALVLAPDPRRFRIAVYRMALRHPSRNPSP